MEISGKVAVITGAASGIGRAVALQLAIRKVRAVALVDMGENVDAVAREINTQTGREVAYAFRGNTTDDAFRRSVFDTMAEKFETISM